VKGEGWKGVGCFCPARETRQLTRNDHCGGDDSGGRVDSPPARRKSLDTVPRGFSLRKYQ